MITNQGLPLVNYEGIDNTDVKTLEDRCPYDFKNNRWVLDEYPESLDLKLKRTYN